MTTNKPSESNLGQSTSYESQYNPALLFPISRAGKREEIGINPNQLPFKGYDIWTHFEVSWLNKNGKPEIAIAEISYNCHSPNIIESKSLKLYFNSLNNTVFESIDAVTATIKQDLSSATQSQVEVCIKPLHTLSSTSLQPHLPGLLIDTLDVCCNTYIVDPRFLKTTDKIAEETLCSNLLKSNCLVTHQPDWGSVQISYKGPEIDQAGLLKYIVSFRNHNEFHEQCIERIFNDILTKCQPSKLTVYGRYTRRGGLDINSYRSTEDYEVTNLPRLIRQ